MQHQHRGFAWQPASLAEAEVFETLAEVADDADAPAAQAAAGGRNPSRELSPELKRQAEILRQEREHIRDTVQLVASGMDSGVELRHSIEKARRNLAATNQRIKHLRHKAETLRISHDGAAQKMKTAMSPRMLTNERRLARKRAAVARRERDVKKWEEVQAQTRASALHAAEEQKHLVVELAEAHVAVERAVKAEEKLKRKHEKVRQRVTHDVQELQTAETRVGASKNELAREVSEERALESSLSKAKATLSEEQLEFAEELAETESKYEKRLSRAQDEKEKAEQEVFTAQDRFLAWQAQQKEKAREVAAMKSEYEARQEAFNMRRDDRIETSMAKAIDSPNLGTEDWAWSL